MNANLIMLILVIGAISLYMYNRSKNFDGVSEYLNTHSVNEMVTMVKLYKLFMHFVVVVLFLASLAMLVKLMAGSLNYEEWDTAAKSSALIATGITAVISVIAGIFHQSPYKTLPLFTMLLIGFGIMSEVANLQGREQVSVQKQSEASPLFQEVVGSIGKMSSAPVVNTASGAHLGRAQRKAATLQERINTKNKCASCEKESFKSLRAALAAAKGDVAAAQARLDTELSAAASNNASAMKTAIAEAKELQYDEGNHFAFIKTLRPFVEALGASKENSANLASALFSLIIIYTLEMTAKLLGRMIADLKGALRVHGLDGKGKKAEFITTERMKAQQEAERTTWNSRLSEAGIDSPHDPAMNQSALSSIINGIIDKGRALGAARSASGADSDTPEGSKKGGSGKPSHGVPEAFWGSDGYDELYTVLRTDILNGHTKPTLRPVIDTITQVMKTQAHLFEGKKFSKEGKQAIATRILSDLESETVDDAFPYKVVTNNDGGVGKAKYVMVQN